MALELKKSETRPLYQFPELSWRRGSNLNTCVEHGIMLRERGRWVIPDFQRGLVWTVEQKVAFLESLILGLPVGEYTLHKTPDYMYEVIDGQQRWDAIFSYVDNQFPVFGLYYRDLNVVSQRGFGNLSFPHHACEGLTDAQKLDAYNRMALGGTPHEVPDSELVVWALTNGWELCPTMAKNTWYWRESHHEDPNDGNRVTWNRKGVPGLTDALRKKFRRLMKSSNRR